MLRFAFDMGTNSIGWAVLDMSNTKSPQIRDMGVRIYTDGREAKTGTPLNEARRDARQMRRQRDRKIRRKKAMLHFLMDNKLMPKERDKQAAVAQLDPYELRAAALERKLEPFELGRTMMQFSIRRGFKSNRKEVNEEKEKEQSSMLEGVQVLKDVLAGQTLGQWLFRQRAIGNTVRFRARIEKTKAIYSFYPSREMYEDEFKRIKEKQAGYYKKVGWDNLYRIIFFQRPLKAPERGRCRFYTGEYRAYKAFVSFQRFRILQDVNNLKYRNDDDVLEAIPVELKRKLFDALDTQESMTFNKIRKLFGKDYTNGFNLEDQKRDKLLGNIISVSFRKPEYFGPAWDGFPPEKKDEIIERLLNEDETAVLEEYLKTYHLSDEQIKNIFGKKLPTGTAFLSSRFMIECADVMYREMITYDKAVEQLGFHHSDKERVELRKKLPYYGEILTGLVVGAKGDDGKNTEEQFGRITNPTVHIALNQLRKLVNALIKRFGPPSGIILELARELKLSQRKKQEMFTEQAKKQRDNERIEAELKKLGFIAPDGEQKKKYKLWEELAVSGTARACPYCGKTISAKQLFNGDVDIEHILPFSRTLKNGRDNLTVAHRGCNQKKGSRSPFEAFKNSPAGFDWQDIRARAEKFPSNKKRKFLPDAMEAFDKQESGFLERQITDTQYISRASKEYLEAICLREKIWVSAGRLTAILRARWGINTLLNKSQHTWFKNRNDHRHHALDALIIGLCDRGLINEAARINSSRGYLEIAVPPCPFERKDIKEKLEAIIVSYKPDHGKEGKLYADTAMAEHSYLEQITPKELAENKINCIVPLSIQKDIALLVQKEGFKKAKNIIQEKYKYLQVLRKKWVTRSPLESLSERDIPNIADPAIREQVQQFLAVHPVQAGQKISDVLAQFAEETGIYSVRYFPKDQVPVPIMSVKNKAYMPGDFYRVDIWRIPLGKEKYKYEGVFVSRPEAIRNDDAKPLRKPHPAAKLIIQLCKNDIIELSNDTIREFCRIAGFSTTNNSIDIRPLYASNTIADWMKDTNTNLTSAFWPSDCKGQNFKSINMLFTTYKIKFVKITVDGRVIYRS